MLRRTRLDFSVHRRLVRTTILLLLLLRRLRSARCNRGGAGVTTRSTSRSYVCMSFEAFNSFSFGCFDLLDLLSAATATLLLPGFLFTNPLLLLRENINIFTNHDPQRNGNSPPTALHLLALALEPAPRDPHQCSHVVRVLPLSLAVDAAPARREQVQARLLDVLPPHPLAVPEHPRLHQHRLSFFVVGIVSSSAEDGRVAEEDAAALAREPLRQGPQEAQEAVGEGAVAAAVAEAVCVEDAGHHFLVVARGEVRVEGVELGCEGVDLGLGGEIGEGAAC